MAWTTRSSLLARLRTGGDAAWAEFVHAYTPLLDRIAGRLGLRGQDVDEAVQAALVDLYLARESFGYDRGRGRFRDYLKQVVVARLVKSARAARRAGTPTGSVPEPGVDDADVHWEREYREHVYRTAAERVRAEVEPRTYQAFDLYVAQGVDAGRVAAFLGVSVSVVYAAKSRVLDRLRAAVAEIEAE